MLSPFLLTKLLVETLETAVSTYALFTAAALIVGVGTRGEAANVFTPVTDSSPELWITTASLAFAVKLESRYCRDTICATTEAGTMLERIAAIVVGEDEGTFQYSV